MDNGGTANGNVKALVSDLGRHAVLRLRVLDWRKQGHIPQLSSRLLGIPGGPA